MLCYVMLCVVAAQLCRLSLVQVLLLRANTWEFNQTLFTITCVIYHYVNRLTGCWLCVILLSVCKGTNVI